MTAYSRITETDLIAVVAGEVFALADAIGKAREAIAEAEGQTHARWQVLEAASSGVSTVSHIARDLGLTRQSVQRVADVLEAEGLLAFKNNPDHVRSPLVKLSARGEGVLKRLDKRARRFHDQLARKTTKRSLSNLSESLGALTDIVARSRGEG